MSTGRPPDDPRLAELLADRAVQGLSEEEKAELRALVNAHPEMDPSVLEFSEFDLVAARADEAISGGSTVPLPGAVRSKLEASAAQWLAGAAVKTAGEPAAAGPVLARISGGGAERPARNWTVWLALAACLALAAAGWWPRLAGGSRGAGVQQMDEFVRGTPDVVRASWGPFNALDSGEKPEIAGVSGEVVWSPGKQQGYMKFSNLPVNNPGVEQYQLWIVDATRGLNQRISGGVFDARAADGVVVIPIAPGLHVDQAAVFAVTIEKPGGTWVSDMKRRVVLAQVKG